MTIPRENPILQSKTQSKAVELVDGGIEDPVEKSMA
jgi:hypothetical protein